MKQYVLVFARITFAVKALMLVLFKIVKKVPAAIEAKGSKLYTGLGRHFGAEIDSTNEVHGIQWASKLM